MQPLSTHRIKLKSDYGETQEYEDILEVTGRCQLQMKSAKKFTETHVGGQGSSYCLSW